MAPGRAWTRYALSLAACAAAYAASGDMGAGNSLPVFAALIFGTLWAGPGPGLAAAALCAAETAENLLRAGAPLTAVVTGSVVFAAEGLVLWAIGARLWRFSGQARQLETRHRRLAETTFEGIWLQDTEGTISYANTRIAEMLGMSPGSLPGRRVDEFYFPDDHAVERIRTGSLFPGARQQFDRRLRRADGSELWVLACCNGVAAEGDLPAGSLAMMTDITERKRAEQALRRSEERYRSLFDNVLEGVYQSTPDGRVLAANPMLMRMLGVASEVELRKLNIANDLYADPVLRRRLVERLEREGSFQIVEYQLRTARGNTIWVLENARAIRSDSGEVYYEGTLIDITERKRAEEQLREAQKTEAVGRMAGRVAQDFNTALGAVVQHIAAAIANLSASHPARFAAEQAMRDASGALALTRQLLNFSRHPAEAGADEPGHAAGRVGGSHGAPQELPLERGGGETILLVEEDPLLRELSRDMLERQGFRVVLAGSAEDAERAGWDKPFDLLIAGLEMQGMRGEELARRLRAAQPRLRALFVTDDGEAAGTDVIGKPFSAEALGRKIRAALSQA